MDKRQTIILAAILLLQFVLLATLSHQRPFLDEGRYMTAGWVFLQGAVPYVDIVSAKPPGVEFVLSAVFSLFGASLFNARMFMAVVACIQIVVVFLFARKIFGERAALFSALFYALWSVQFSAYFAIIAPFLALLATIAVLFLYSYLFEGNRERHLFAGCFFLGALLVFKQTMLPFVLGMLAFLLLFIHFKKRQIVLLKIVPVMLAGLAAIPLLLLLYLAANNALLAFVESMLFAFNRAGFFQVVLDARVLVAVLAFSPVPVLLWMSHKGFLRLKQKHFEILLLLLWFLLAFSNTLPFRGCCLHLLPSLPAASVAAGAVICYGLRKPAQTKALASFSVLLLLSSIASALFFQYAFLLPEYSFCGIEEVASHIKENSAEQDSILVLPASPELYFLSQRKPAARQFVFFDEYTDREQQLVIDDLLLSRPRFIVYFARDSGDAFSGLALVDQFIKDNYGLRKTIEMTPPLYKFFHYALVFEPE